MGYRYGLALATVLLCVLLGALLEAALPLHPANLSLVFLTGVLIVAARTGLAPALLTAVLCFLAYNFFFTEPRATFKIYHADDVVMVFLFLLVALIGGDLAHRLRIQMLALQAGSARSAALLSLSQRLAEAPHEQAVCEVAAEEMAGLAGASAVVFTGDAREELHLVAFAPEDRYPPEVLREAAYAAARTGAPQAVPTQHGSEAGWRVIPLAVDGLVHGVLAIESTEAPEGYEESGRILVEAAANQVASTLARARLAAGLEAARVAEGAERLRASLLASVSHDLRTPLASIIGSASTLRELAPRLSDEHRQELLDAVLGESRRLDRYIGNLLEMTRLGDGAMRLERDWSTVEDLVGAALRRTRDVLGETPVRRRMPKDLPLLYVHPALIEQALVNVIENAARFSPCDGVIEVSARRIDDRVRIEITDEGPGIPLDLRERVFERFFSSGGDAGHQGTGLGLAIARGMVLAHGGGIEMRDGPDGRGTTAVIELPVPKHSGHPPVEMDS
ncbi:sensor histidine kinase [Spiribacter halobius]|nr:ATP-binding protein [Spiribacter halobius]UEX79158.1 DUF4118 domain-containing protein [Spiribacter halobius]